MSAGLLMRRFARRTVASIREIVREAPLAERRYLVIATGTADAVGPAVQIQSERPTGTSVNGANDE